MRALVVNPLVLALSAMIGVLICHAIGWDPRLRELIWAAGICFIAAESGMLPLMLHRSLGVHPAQAGLLATVVHLMLATMIGGAVLLLLHPPLAFVVWLLVFYWISLIFVAVAAIRVVRAAPLSRPGFDVQLKSH